MKRKETLKPIGEVCNELFDAAQDDIEGKYPHVARCVRYGFRAMESPHEQSVIRAARYARRCGKTAGWIADQLNRHRVKHRGRDWTARSIRWILRHYDDHKGKIEDKDGQMAELFRKTEKKNLTIDTE